MSSEPAPTPERFSGDTPFSYECLRCKRCCHDKLIQCNPYEIARMARHLGVSTTEFIRDFLEEGVYLRRVGNGACVFLGEQGCGVHADRPLVCRLYPLGRHVVGSEAVSYSRLEPHPHSEGRYGVAGTAEDYVRAQGTAPFIAAADLYLGQLAALLAAWREDEQSGDTPRAGSPLPSVEAPDFSDMDAAVASFCIQSGITEPQDLEARMQLHLRAVRLWLEARR